MSESDTERAFKATADGRIKTDWKTVVGLILAVATFVTCWNDLRNGQRECARQLKALLGQVVYSDELERFSTQLERHNRSLNLVLPGQDEYLRRGRAEAVTTNDSMGLALKVAQKGTAD